MALENLKVGVCYLLRFAPVCMKGANCSGETPGASFCFCPHMLIRQVPAGPRLPVDAAKPGPREYLSMRLRAAV